jgi:hypothetical protein
MHILIHAPQWSFVTNELHEWVKVLNPRYIFAVSNFISHIRWLRSPPLSPWSFTIISTLVYLFGTWSHGNSFMLGNFGLLPCVCKHECCVPSFPSGVSHLDHLILQTFLFPTRVNELRQKWICWGVRKLGVLQNFWANPLVSSQSCCQNSTLVWTYWGLGLKTPQTPENLPPGAGISGGAEILTTPEFPGAGNFAPRARISGVSESRL